MRLLSIDGWDLPCALPTPTGGKALPSCLKKCRETLAEFDFVGKAVHILEVANPVHVVTDKNRSERNWVWR